MRVPQPNFPRCSPSGAGRYYGKSKCSLAGRCFKFSFRLNFGSRRRLAGGVAASLNRRRRREEQERANGLLILEGNLLYLFCSSHFVIQGKVNFVLYVRLYNNSDG